MKPSELFYVPQLEYYGLRKEEEMSDFSVILDDMRDKLSEISAMYCGGELTEEAFRMFSQHVLDLMLYRMLLYKRKEK